jgi:hypothetical protein
VSTTKRPSAVSGLRRGVDAVQAEPGLPVSAPPGPAEAGRPPRPPKDVRFTLDLAEDRHAFLKRFAEESGAGVRASQVMRALLEELEADQDLAARVRSRIWQRMRLPTWPKNAAIGEDVNEPGI